MVVVVVLVVVVVVVVVVVAVASLLLVVTAIIGDSVEVFLFKNLSPKYRLRPSIPTFSNIPFIRIFKTISQLVKE